MTKHTPGPLHVRVAPHPESGQSSADYMASLLRGASPLFVVVADDPDRPAPDYLVTAVTGDGPAALANARLYASAPELLRLLKRAAPAVAELHGRGIGCPDCEDDGRECAFVEAMDREIAKAEGR